MIGRAQQEKIVYEVDDVICESFYYATRLPNWEGVESRQNMCLLIDFLLPWTTMFDDRIRCMLSA